MTYSGSKTPLILGVMWAETIAAFVFVLARLYTRTFLVRNMGWDDHLINISMVLFFGYTTMCTVATFNGMGSHAADLGITQTVIAVKWEIAGQAMNIMAIATSKNSVALFLLRIVVKTSHQWVLWFCIASTSFVCASCIIFMFTQCTPLASIFNPTIPHTCSINFTANAIFSGSYTAVMDFVLAIFPWFILWKVNMKRKERLTIAFGLSLGALAGICGVVRAVQLQAISGKADYTFLTVPLILWGSTELLVCIICASIPTLRPLYKAVRGQGSSNAPYELGQTPSHHIGTGANGKSGNAAVYGGGTRSGRADSVASLTGRGASTNIWEGVGADGSEEEIGLKDLPIQGREDMVKFGGGNGNGNAGRKVVIHRTTEVDIVYNSKEKV